MIKSVSKFTYCILLAIIFLVYGCTKDEPITSTPIACDSSKLPIVMLHGFLASGDTYSNFFQLFKANGYCNNALYVMDRNTLALNDDFNPAVDAFIDEVLLKTGAEKVNLIGHSAGGGVAYAYLADSIRALKVNRYAHLASFVNDAPAGPSGEIPTINVYSDADKIVAGQEIPGARNINLIVADHYQVATSIEAFQFVYAFLNNDKPAQTLQAITLETIELEGKVLTLGENQAIGNASISVFELNAETGARLSEMPTIITNSNATGNFNNVSVKANTAYEFFVDNPSDENFIPLHYYFEPFKSSNSLIYLRTIPPLGSAAGGFLAGVPKNDAQAVAAVFTATQAIFNLRDELFINNVELSTAELCSEDQSTIALFLYDDNDAISSGKIHDGLLANFPFLNAADIFMNPASNEFSTITFNDDKVVVPHWPSKTDGFSIVVFD